MKVCIIFRGENERNYEGYVNACNYVENWKKTLFNDLEENGYDYDIVFVTYESNILNELKAKINPKEIIICEKEGSSQHTNFNIATQYIIKNRDIYERFVVLRFDIIYKLNVTKWNSWDKKGIIILNKDSSWNHTKFYNDIIFIVDNTEIDNFRKGVEYMMNIDSIPVNLRISHHRAMPHHIGQYLYINNIEFITMYDISYDGLSHPLYEFVRKLATY